MASKKTASSTRKVKTPAAAKTPKPPSAPLPNQMEQLWAIVKANPGATGMQVVKLAAAIGIAESGGWTRLSQLAKRGVLANRGTEAAEGPRRYWVTSEAYPAAKQRAKGVAVASQPSEAAPAASVVPSVAPSVVPEPAKTPRPAEPAVVAQKQEAAAAEPPKPQRRAGIARVFWKQEEIEALCMKWAVDHLTIATRLSDKGLLRVARLEGQGYRPRDMTALARREFMALYLPLVERLVKDLRESKNKPAAEAPAAAAPAAQPQQAPEAQAQREPTIGELIDRAIEHTVQEAVKKALVVQEEKLLASLAEMLKGIPGYNRPIVIKRAEPEPQPKDNKPLYQVIIVGGLPAQFDSVRRAFPQLDVRLVGEGRMPHEQDPDLVVGVTRFMSHPLERALKKKYGPRYYAIPPSGASDAIKGAIQRKLQVQMAH